MSGYEIIMVILAFASFVKGLIDFLSISLCRDVQERKKASPVCET